MALEIVAWNVRDGFSDENRIADLLYLIRKLDPAAAVFSEAYAEGREGLLDEAQRKLERVGFTVVHGPYEDSDGRADRHGILAVARMSQLATGEIIRLGNRNAVKFNLSYFTAGTEVKIDFVGAHLDDRREATRLQQVDAMLDQIEPGNPTILAGDFNSLHGGDVRARLFRAVGPLANRLPPTEPGVQKRALGASRLGSLAVRLVDMASGETLERLETAGFRDTDWRHRPTFPGRRPVAQLDHIMVNQELETIRHRVHERSELSDHRAVSALVEPWSGC